MWIFILVKRWVRMIPMVALVNWYTYSEEKWLRPALPNAFVSMLGCDNGNQWTSWLFFYIWGNRKNDGICAGWLWYLYIDYASYMLVPLILIGLSYSKWLGMFLAFIPFCASTIWSIIQAIDKKTYNNIQVPSYMGTYYFSLWTRCCVFFMGCMFAIYTLENPRKKTNTKGDLADTNIVEVDFNIDDSGFGKNTYKLKPDKTSYSKLKEHDKEQRTKTTTVVITLVSVAIILINCIIFNWYFQFGRDTEK